MSELTQTPSSPSETGTSMISMEHDDLMIQDCSLPGIGKPLNSVTSSQPVCHTTDEGTRLRFPSAVIDWGGRALTLRERAMMSMMSDIMEKADWQTKVFDDTIVEKWRSEAVKEDRDFSQPMFDYSIKELRENAGMSRSQHFSPAISANAVVFTSDALVEDALLGQLKTAARPLEDVPDAEKDWHPGSKGLVLDLVHPSLFPLVYGRSRIVLNDKVPLADGVLYSGKGAEVPVPQDSHLDDAGLWHPRKKVLYSKRFQWLPCEVALQADGSIGITSLINNLHPQKHHDLYVVLEMILSKVIPMWDATLTEVIKPVNVPEVVLDPITHGCYAPRIRVTGMPEWAVDGPIAQEGESDEEDAFEEVLYGENWERSGLTQPEPSVETWAARKALLQRTKQVNLRHDFASSGLQVIVKLANIHLEADSPKYDGGTWHIEGQLNEHICASALLYYDSENITDSYLAFRERIDETEFAWGGRQTYDRGYAQFDYMHMEQLFGVESHESSAIQYLGHVHTKQGRLVTFPNVLQHRVEPFELQDKTKPGHRKILALFLVDPYIKIPSTANVPPQQKDWWRDTISSLDRTGALPPELVENIVDQAGDSLMDMEEAKTLREELMAERSAFVQDVNRDYEEWKISFCEH